MNGESRPDGRPSQLAGPDLTPPASTDTALLEAEALVQWAAVQRPEPISLALTSYQLLPPLPDELRAALKADIAARGVMVPVEVDEDGVVLDGHHRAEIAAELGIEYPTVTRTGMDESAKRVHVLKINLLHRQLGPIGWAIAFRHLAEERGVKLGQGQRNGRTSATVAEVAIELGVSPRTARWRLQVADELADYLDLAAEVEAGTRDAGLAQRIAWDRRAKADRQEREARRHQTVPEPDPSTSRQGPTERAYWTPRQWLVSRPNYPSDLSELHQYLRGSPRGMAEPPKEVLAVRGLAEAADAWHQASETAKQIEAGARLEADALRRRAEAIERAAAKRAQEVRGAARAEFVRFAESAPDEPRFQVGERHVLLA